MDAVNEFKKLLELDLTKLQNTLSGDKNLEVINREFEKLSHQLLNGGPLDNGNSDLNVIIANEENSKPCNSHEDIHPGIDGSQVKSFEELIAIKMQHENQQRKSSNEQSPVKKKPFLKRGEGLKRFSKGNANSPKHHEDIASALQWNSPTNKVRKDGERNVEKLSGKDPILPTHISEKCTIKRTDFARKVMPISTKPTSISPPSRVDATTKHYKSASSLISLKNIIYEPIYFRKLHAMFCRLQMPQVINQITRFKEMSFPFPVRHKFAQIHSQN